MPTDSAMQAVVHFAHSLGVEERLALVREILVETEAERGFIALPSGWAVFTEEYADYNPENCVAFFTIPGSSLASQKLLASLYFIAMLYIFVGIVVMAETFMGSIEVIVATKFERTKRLKDGTVVPHTVRMINPTVANVSLMALGTSLPECVLAVIGVITTLHAPPDVLGPSTIVGTAAYNFTIITSLCAASIPAGVVKPIKKVDVYIMTSVWSISAYIWMYIVLAVISPDIIELWEAIVTLVLFFIFLFFAYAQDVKWRWCRSDLTDADFEDAEADGGHSHAAPKRPKKAKAAVAAPSGITVEELLHVHASASVAPQSKRQDEIMRDLAMAKGARRSLHVDKLDDAAPPGARLTFTGGLGAFTGGQRFEAAEIGGPSDGGGLKVARRRTASLTPGAVPYGSFGAADSKHPQEEIRLGRRRQGSNATRQGSNVGRAGIAAEMMIDMSKLTVEFSHTRFDVAAGATRATAVVIRKGDTTQAVGVGWSTEASADGAFFTAASGTLTLNPGESQGLIHITLDGSSREGNVSFGLKLDEPATFGAIKAVLGRRKRALLNVVGTANEAFGPKQGVACFATPTLFCSREVGQLHFTIERETDCEASLEVVVNTANGSARAGTDYAPEPVVVSFAPYEVTKTGAVRIAPTAAAEPRTFELLLQQRGVDAMGAQVCKVTILSAEAFNEQLGYKIQTLRRELESTMNASGSDDGWGEWGDKFRDALQLFGAYNEETGEELEPTAWDCVMHFLTVFWKLQLATVPPKEWGNGWPAFCWSMGVIILWTCIMFFLAKCFGCASGLSDAAVAIAFLAGGTSLPDTFSSRIAAMHMNRADEAIGNINGSNAVNVFLGLGLPWCIGAFYHQFAPTGNGVFKQPAGNLAFTVVLFVILDVACVTILYVRRRVFGGELGGPLWGTRVTWIVLIFLYLLFVVLAITNESGAFTSFRR